MCVVSVYFKRIEFHLDPSNNFTLTSIFVRLVHKSIAYRGSSINYGFPILPYLMKGNADVAISRSCAHCLQIVVVVKREYNQCL